MLLPVYAILVVLLSETPSHLPQLAATMPTTRWQRLVMSLLLGAEPAAQLARASCVGDAGSAYWSKAVVLALLFVAVGECIRRLATPPTEAVAAALLHVHRRWTSQRRTGSFLWLPLCYACVLAIMRCWSGVAILGGAAAIALCCHSPAILSRSCGLPPPPAFSQMAACCFKSKPRPPHWRSDESADSKPVDGPRDLLGVAASYWQARLQDAPTAKLPNTSRRGGEAALLGGPLVIEPPNLAALLREATHTIALPEKPSSQLLRDVSNIEVAAATLTWVAAVHTREHDCSVLVDCGAVLRLHASGEQRLMELIVEASSQLERAAEHVLPFEELLRCAPSGWTSARPPFLLHVTRGAERPAVLEAAVTLQLWADKKGERARLFFDPRFFSRVEATHWAERMEHTLSAPTEQPLQARSLMGPAEAQQVVVEFNRTAAPFPNSPGADTLQAQLRRACGLHKGAVALRMVGDGDALAPVEEVSYADFARRTSLLAMGCAKLGLVSASHRLVGLIFERSIEMVVAVFGVLKLGAAYLPIEPSTPAACVGLMLDETRSKLCLLQAAQLADVVPVHCSCSLYIADAAGRLRGLLPSSCIDRGPNEPTTTPSGEDERHALPCGGNDLAYVMYTSGTTGKPKGVEVTHGPLLMRVAWMQRTYDVGVGDVVPFKTAFIFGVSEWELFWTLTHGATLAIMPHAIVKQPKVFATALLAERAAVAFLIPSQVDALLPELAAEAERSKSIGQRALNRVLCRPPKVDSRLSLRHVICCGESLKAATVGRFFDVMVRPAARQNREHE